MNQNVKVSNGSLYPVIEIWYNRITKEKEGRYYVNGKKYC